VNARLAYTTLAWGNRFGAPKAVDKQRILDEMDDQLATMDVTSDERAEIRRSYVRFIAYDFYYLFIRSIDYAANRRREELLPKNNAALSDADSSAAHIREGYHATCFRRRSRNVGAAHVMWNLMQPHSAAARLTTLPLFFEVSSCRCFRTRGYPTHL
jgi:hypothetical protein